jgi:lipid II:glycine glycyltransferase (peptidoglycan interpeptide bridge formation enzyme)
VRKALKSGVTVEPVTDRKFLDLFFPMVEASYARHRAVSPHPKQFFLSMYDRLMPQGLMGIFAAKYQGQVIAAALVPHDRREARCMSIGSIPEYHQYFPNNLLQWHIITWACAAGFERYDFGGKGDPGINRFKETFGPSPYAYAFYWLASPPVALARTLVLRAWPRVQWWRYQAREIASRARKGGAPLAAPMAHQEEP